MEEYLQLKEDIHNEKVIIAKAWQDTVKITPEENIGSIPYPTSFLYMDHKIESLQEEVTQKLPLFSQLESGDNKYIKENTQKIVSYFYFTIKQTLRKLLELVEISQLMLQALKNFKRNEFRAAITRNDVIPFITHIYA
ncbi:uncharacterized protein METZ01_LOCUS182508 [marine metagenome]|uniref:Uncharacterized protein n=1 Tax=marine metagenome TaxID=408172 RepID=A0A382CV11_9ZZZZ